MCVCVCMLWPILVISSYLSLSVCLSLYVCFSVCWYWTIFLSLRFFLFLLFSLFLSVYISYACISASVGIGLQFKRACLSGQCRISGEIYLRFSLLPFRRQTHSSGQGIHSVSGNEFQSHVFFLFQPGK